MSKIFDIDGEMEENDDQKSSDNQNQDNTSPEENTDDKEGMGAEIMPDQDGEDDDGDTPKDDDIPWYDRVLNESDEKDTPTDSSNAETENAAEDQDDNDEDYGISIINDDDDDEDELGAPGSTDLEQEMSEAESAAEGGDESTGESYNPMDETVEDDETVPGIRKASTEQEVSDEERDWESSLTNENAQKAKPKSPKPKAQTGKKKGATKKPATSSQKPTQNSQQNKAEEDFDDIFPKGKRKPLSISTIVFMFLFLATLSLLCYYQFYDGNSFSINFTHPSNKGISTADDAEALDDQIKAVLAEKENTIKLLKQKIEEEKAAGGSSVTDDATGSDNKGAATTGTVYQVQLVALRQYDPNLQHETMELVLDREGGFTKLLLGTFTQEREALQLNSKLRQAGFDDAFVVKKVDGKRVAYDPN